MIINYVTDEEMMNMPIDTLDLSARAQNIFKRIELKTIGEIINLIENEKLDTLRNMGETTSREIRNSIINLSISRMNEKQLQDFWYSLIEKNSTEDLKPVFQKFALYEKDMVR